MSLIGWEIVVLCSRSLMLSKNYHIFIYLTIYLSVYLSIYLWNHSRDGADSLPGMALEVSVGMEGKEWQEEDFERRKNDALSTLRLWASAVFPGKGTLWRHWGASEGWLSWLSSVLAWLCCGLLTLEVGLWAIHNEILAPGTVCILGPGRQAACWISPLPYLNPTLNHSSLRVAFEGKETQAMLVPLGYHCHLFQEAPLTTPFLSSPKRVNLCRLAAFCPRRE